jgi:hypothetical protein
MKKILLFVSIMPSIIFAQIGSIQTEGKQFEHVGHYMVRYVATNQYELLIQSDNHYEDKIVRLSLGSGPTEAVTSLSHLHETFYGIGQSFTLQGYTFGIDDKMLCAQVSSATGNFCISANELCDEMLTLIIDKGAEFGELSIVQGYTSTGDYLLSFDTYGFTDFVHIGKDISKRMSHTYNDFETISQNDVRVLRAIIEENYMSVTHASLGIIVCDVILGDYK